MDDAATGRLWLADGQTGVTFVRKYPVTTEQLWAAITRPEQLARWFNPVSGDLRVGGDYGIAFGEGDHGGGTVRSCNPPRAFTVSYQHENVPDDEPGDATLDSAADSLLSVTLDDAGNGMTRLTLRHAGLPPAQAAGHAAGWHAFLDRLGALLTGGALPDWDDRFQILRATYRAQGEALTGSDLREP